MEKESATVIAMQPAIDPDDVIMTTEKELKPRSEPHTGYSGTTSSDACCAGCVYGDGLCDCFPCFNDESRCCGIKCCSCDCDPCGGDGTDGGGDGGDCCNCDCCDGCGDSCGGCGDCLNCGGCDCGGCDCGNIDCEGCVCIGGCTIL